MLFFLEDFLFNPSEKNGIYRKTDVRKHRINTDELTRMRLGAGGIGDLSVSKSWKLQLK